MDVIELFNKYDIDQIVSEIAGELNNRYLTTNAYENTPVLCPILSGAAMFANDLMKLLNFDFTVEYCKYSSYKGTQSGELKEILPIPEIPTQNDIILIEDLIDTGQTIMKLIEELEGRGNKVIVCSLLSKPDRHSKEIEDRIDYVGVRIPDNFVFGYGMDLGYKMRGLNRIIQVV